MAAQNRLGFAIQLNVLGAGGPEIYDVDSDPNGSAAQIGSLALRRDVGQAWLNVGGTTWTQLSDGGLHNPIPTEVVLGFGDASEGEIVYYNTNEWITSYVFDVLLLGRKSTLPYSFADDAVELFGQYSVVVSGPASVVDSSAGGSGHVYGGSVLVIGGNASSTQVGVSKVYGGAVFLRGGEPTGLSADGLVGGFVEILGGPSPDQGGGVQIFGGQGTSGKSSGGSVTIRGGRSAGAAGAVSVEGGIDDAGVKGGQAFVFGGKSAVEGGDVLIQGGDDTPGPAAGSVGGNVAVRGGLGGVTGFGGNVEISGGRAGSGKGGSNYGDVEIGTGTGGKVTVTTRDGNVEISTTGGDVEISTTTGGIVHVDASGKYMSIEHLLPGIFSTNPYPMNASVWAGQFSKVGGVAANTVTIPVGAGMSGRMAQVSFCVDLSSGNLVAGGSISFLSDRAATASIAIPGAAVTLWDLTTCRTGITYAGGTDFEFTVTFTDATVVGTVSYLLTLLRTP